MLRLKQTFALPISGYWEGGAKSVFYWRIEGRPSTDSRGVYVRIGSWSANHWFHVAKGKTDKLTLSYAKHRLQAITRIPCTFEYIESES